MQENDFEREFDINGSNENKSFGAEEVDNAQDADSCCQVGENNSQESFGQAQESGLEKEDAHEKEKDTPSEEEHSGSAEYVWSSKEGLSYHFKPENMKEYVGTASYAQRPADDNNTAKKKNRQKKKPGKIAIPIAIVLSLAIGLGGGLLIGKALSSDENFSKGEAGKVDITKNEAGVDVEVNVENTNKKILSRTEVVEMVSDAVVEVTTATVNTDSIFGNYVTGGAGSGVVFARSGDYVYVVTNHHVVAGASSVSITTSGGVEIEAEYLDGDAVMDIAMLRVKTDIEFPQIEYGSSDSLRVGQDVVAIGNPLGELGGTVTEGIISALDRQVIIEGIPMTLLQTSAAVNPGNSGGGLFNMAGELIAIVNAKQSAAGIEGLGFAIPIDTILDSLVEIVETSYIHGRPSLGIEVEYVTDRWEARLKYSMSATGVFVTSSDSDVIRAKDLLYSINGERIIDELSYISVLSSLEIGQTVKIELYRNGIGMSVEAEVTEYVPAGIFN